MVPSCKMHTHTNYVINGIVHFYQDQLVLPVSNMYQWAVKGMGCEPVTVTHARTLLVRLWVLVLLVDKHVPSICVKLMYIWAMLLTGQVFSRVPHRHASLFCQWVLLHGWLTLMWRSLKMSSLLGRYDSPRCYRPIPLCGRTNSYNLFLRSHQAWVSDRFIKRHECRTW